MKKRGVSKVSILPMFKMIIQHTNTLKTNNEKIKLLTAITLLIHGRLYLEKEHAKTAHNLAKLLVLEGNDIEAWNLIGKIQIET